MNSVYTLTAVSSGSSNTTDGPLDGEGGTDPEDGAFNSYEEMFADLAINVDIPDGEGTDNLQLYNL